MTSLCLVPSQHCLHNLHSCFKLINCLMDGWMYNIFPAETECTTRAEKLYLAHTYMLNKLNYVFSPTPYNKRILNKLKHEQSYVLAFTAPFYQWGNRGLERWRVMLRVTKLVSDDWSLNPGLHVRILLRGQETQITWDWGIQIQFYRPCGDSEDSLAGKWCKWY